MGHSEDILKEMQAALRDRVARIVSEKSGVHYNTILRIKNGQTKNVRGETVDKIRAYLDRDDA